MVATAQQQAAVITNRLVEEKHSSIELERSADESAEEETEELEAQSQSRSESRSES
jgi:hypothetical protein